MHCRVFRRARNVHSFRSVVLNPNSQLQKKTTIKALLKKIKCIEANSFFSQACNIWLSVSLSFPQHTHLLIFHRHDTGILLKTAPPDLRVSAAEDDQQTLRTDVWFKVQELLSHNGRFFRNPLPLAHLSVSLRRDHTHALLTYRCYFSTFSSAKIDFLKPPSK